jgi:hypothetical protein
MDYKDFNKITVKNRHPLFLVGEILDRLNEAVIYTKFNLKNIYYKIRIRERDEWKTIFRISYSHFEYKTMLFDLINAPAIF